MERTCVDSTSIRSIGYDDGSSILEVEFHSGRIYSYAGVPREMHQWLMRTPGKGGYFNRMIRDQFQMRDVTPGEVEIDLEASLRRSLEER